MKNQIEVDIKLRTKLVPMTSKVPPSLQRNRLVSFRSGIALKSLFENTYTYLTRNYDSAVYTVVHKNVISQMHTSKNTDC